MEYEIVKVIGGFMVYRGRVGSQVYMNYYDAEQLAKWLTKRDAGYP
jgi:hypothetical protein